MMKIIAALASALLLFGPPSAGTRWDLVDVDTNKMIGEQQPVMTSPDDRVDFAWDIPVEFWKAVLAQDSTVTDARAKTVISALEPYFLVGVVQADLSALGSMDFYDERTTRRQLNVSHVDKSGRKRYLTPIQNIDPDVEILIQQMAPILSNAMGNMGEHFFFLVYHDRDAYGARIVDPYQPGEIRFGFTNRDGDKPSHGTITCPLDSLYVPRTCMKCSKDAHVSWDFCPWDGMKLRAIQ